MRKSRSRGGPGLVPLARALSKLGALTRSQAIQATLDGRVTVSGRPVRDPGYPVSPERDALAVDGVPARRPSRRLLAMHKPRGYVTTRADPQGRPTVYDLLPPGSDDLRAVGRLDLATSGLLLFTNDTRLAHRLTDPDAGVERTYVVDVRGSLDEAVAGRLATEGLDDGGEHLQAARVVVRKRSGRESQVLVTLTEGRNREIRRLFAGIGHPVTRLRRIAFGPVDLGDLAPGQVRELDPAIVALPP